VDTSTKTLIILRHAKSDWSTGAPDFDRPLTDLGRLDAHAAGNLISSYPIDLVWCSAAKRTQETWEQAHLGGAQAKEIDVRRSFYDTWVDALISEMTLLDDTVSTLAIVNHQPTVGDLVFILARPSTLTSQVSEHFPTAGVAVLSYQGSWASIRGQDLVLDRFDRVRA
jgi:phosphohistidine phosphatase